MKTKLLAGLLLAGSALMAAPRVSIGVGFGVPAPVYVAPAPVYAAPAYAAPAYVEPAYVPPPAPVVYARPGYAWVNGYWYWGGGRRMWREGYWAPRHAYPGGRAYYRR